MAYEIYDDDYPTCDKTNGKLVVSSDDISPRKIAEILCVDATSSCEKGTAFGRPRDGVRPTRRRHVWILSSEEAVASKDLRRHIDWITNKLAPHKSGLHKLRELNAVVQLRIVWWSKHGHGGPIIGLEQMSALCQLGLDCDFEIGFYSEDNWVDQIGSRQ